MQITINLSPNVLAALVLALIAFAIYFLVVKLHESYVESRKCGDILHAFEQRRLEWRQDIRAQRAQERKMQYNFQ